MAQAQRFGSEPEGPGEMSQAQIIPDSGKFRH